jgi:hypothetical protein
MYVGSGRSNALRLSSRPGTDLALRWSTVFPCRANISFAAAISKQGNAGADDVAARVASQRAQELLVAVPDAAGLARRLADSVVR